MSDVRFDQTPVETRLVDDITVSFPEQGERQRLVAELGQFKKRIRTTGLSEKSYTDTAEIICHLLEAKEGKVDRQKRILAAKTLLKNVANPNDMIQGDHPTCGPASVDHILALKFPTIEAHLVQSAAIRGKVFSPQGNEKDIPDECLEPGAEELRSGIFCRSYASQLAQVSILNDIGQSIEPPMTYMQCRPVVNKNKLQQDQTTPEYWLLKNGDKQPIAEPCSGDLVNRGVWSVGGGMTFGDVAAELYRLTGTRQGIMLNRKEEHDNALSQDCRPAGIIDDNCLDVRSLSQLETTLKTLKAENKLPIMAEIDGPYFARDFLTKDKANHLNHCITIDDYVPARDDQPAGAKIHSNWPNWGPVYNGWFKLTFLAKSMMLKE